MGQLEDMALFVRIIEAEGIGKAAEQLQLAKSAVSRRLSELEKRLGSQLLSRTTRHYKLTAAGEVYYRRCLNILDEVELSNDEASGITSSLQGTLKLTAPLSFGLMHLEGLINQFSKQHPDLNIQLDLSDRQIDLVEEGYELALRIGNLKDSTLKAKRITTIKHSLCASPEYLATHGKPQIPDDLSQHPFLLYSTRGRNDAIETNDLQGNKNKIAVSAKMKANNGEFLRAMAIKNHGITYLPTFLTCDAVNSGLLIPLLKEYQLPLHHLYAVYPHTRFLSKRCRLFIDFIHKNLGDEPYWDNCVSTTT